MQSKEHAEPVRKHRQMMSKRDAATEWLLRGPVALPELCDLICKCMLAFEGLSSEKLWDFPPSIIKPEISLLDNDRVALFYRSTLEVREIYTGVILWDTQKLKKKSPFFFNKSQKTQLVEARFFSTP